MPCRFASSGTVATSRSASRAILALNVASNFLRDLVISVLRRLRQSRTLHTLTFGPISGVHFSFRLSHCVLLWVPNLLTFKQWEKFLLLEWQAAHGEQTFRTASAGSISFLSAMSRFQRRHHVREGLRECGPMFKADEVSQFCCRLRERLTTGSVCCGEPPTASTIWRTNSASSASA